MEAGDAMSDDWSPPSARAVDDEWTPPSARALDVPANDVPSAPAAQDIPSGARSGVLGFAQGGTFNFADEIGSLAAGRGGVRLGAGLLPAPDDTPEVRAAKASLLAQVGSQPSASEMLRDRMRAEADSARINHPWQYWPGYVGGTVASTIPLGLRGVGALAGQVPLFAARGEALTANLGKLLWQGAKTGAWTGGLGGLGASQEQTLGGLAKDTALSGFGGFLLGGVPGGLARLGQGGWRLGNMLLRGGYVKPTPESVRLAAAGVEQTLGQKDPSSLFGRTEELAAKSVIGGSLDSARGQTASSARDALIRAAGAKGATPPTAGAPVAQQLKELKAGFTQLYDDALEDVWLEPAKYRGQGKWTGLLTDKSVEGAARMKGAFELAAKRVKEATPSTQRRALLWLTEQAKALVPRKSGPNAGKVEAKAIQALRTQILDRLDELGDEPTGADRHFKEIYTHAKDFVTELLEGQLPQENLESLRAADASYRNLIATKAAAKRAFVHDQEFTPTQLLQQIGTHGATPELEALARDAHAVLNPTYNPNGIFGAAPLAIPGYKVLGPAWALAANAMPAMRERALRPLQSMAPRTTLADMFNSAVPSPQAAMTRLIQPDRLGSMFPMSTPAEAY